MTRSPPRVVRLGLMWMIGAPIITFFLVGGLLFWYFLPAIGIGQIWVAVSLLLVVVYGAISWKVGKGRARQARLTSEGLRGFATVLEAEGTGMAVNHRPQVHMRLRVEIPDREPYELEHREILPFLGLESIGLNRRVAVFVDREDPNQLVIDWSAAAQSRPPAAAERGAGTDELAARLAKLDNLHQRGLISKTEFDAQRQRLLSEI